MSKHDTATEVATISARCMQAELDARRQCISELEALEPDTASEHKLRDDTLTGIREAAGKLEAQITVMRMMADVLGRAAAAEAAKAGGSL